MIIKTDYNNISPDLLKYLSQISPNKSEIECYNVIEDRLLLRNKEGYEGVFSYHTIRAITGCSIKDNRLELGAYKWGFPTSEDRSPLFLANGNAIIAVSQYVYQGDE